MPDEATISRPRTRPRRRRWLAVALVVLSVVAAGLLAAHEMLLPRVVRSRVMSAFADAGFPNARFTLTDATLWQADLADVVLGDGLRLGRLGLAYSPASLWDGRLAAIELSGASLVVRAADGRIDLGPVGPLLLGSREGPARPTGDDGGIGTLPVDAIRLRNSALVLELPDGTVRLPVEGTLDVDPTGRARAMLGLGVETPDSRVEITGAIDVAADAVTLDIKSPGLGAPLLQRIAAACGVANPTAATGTVALEASLNWTPSHRALTFQLTPHDLTIEPAATDPPNPVTLSGVLSGVVEFAGAGTTDSAAPRLRLTVAAGEVRSEAWSLDASGIAGTVLFDGLGPLHTPPGQELRIAQATLGEVELFDGVVGFRVEGPDRYIIDRARWAVFDGEVSADDVHLTADPAAGPTDVTVRLDDVALGPLLDLLAQDKAEGEGRISGRLTLRLDWPDVTIVDGLLVAERSGQLRVSDVDELVAIVEQSVSQAATIQGRSEQAVERVKQRVVEALRDFEFDSLTARIDREPDGGLVARIHLVGHGRTGAQQPIDYQLNVRGLEDLLRAVLLIRGRMSEAQ